MGLEGGGGLDNSVFHVLLNNRCSTTARCGGVEWGGGGGGGLENSVFHVLPNNSGVWWGGQGGGLIIACYSNNRGVERTCFSTTVGCGVGARAPRARRDTISAQ